jgi:TRAP-type uncharacterized transport system fused permease subunit
MAVPALTRLEVLPIAAHLFVCYFAVLADITPPVCIAAYAAAGVAQAEPMKTGFSAWKLGIAGFLVPYIFCYESALLGLGSVTYVLFAVATAIFGVILLGAAVERYLLTNASAYEFALLILGAVSLMKPGLFTDLIGFGFLSITLLSQFLRNRRQMRVKQVGV